MDGLNCAYCGKVIDADGDWIESQNRKMIGGTGFARYSQVIGTNNYHTTCWTKRAEMI